MRRKPSVLLLSMLVHAAALFVLATAELWSPVSNWPLPREVLAFSENRRLVHLVDIELPRSPRRRASGAATPIPSSPDAVPELAPVVASSGIAPESGLDCGPCQPGRIKLSE